MKNCIIVYIIAGAVLLVLFASCKGPYLPIERTHKGQPLQHSRRTVILDRNVRDALLYVNSVQKRLPGGQIFVQANFQNRFQGADIWADVKIEFLDENNMLVDETEWVNTYFPQWEVTMVQGNSISSQAVKHVMLMKNLKTPTGVLPRTFGTIFELPWFPSVLPK